MELNSVRKGVFGVLLAMCLASPVSCRKADCTSATTVSKIVENLSSNNSSDTLTIVVPTAETVIIASPYAITTRMLDDQFSSLSESDRSQLLESSNSRESVMIAVVSGECLSDLSWLADRFRVRNPESVLVLRGEVTVAIERSESDPRSLALYIDSE